MRWRSLVSGLVLWFSALQAFAEVAALENVSYIPQSYYVGDRVELRAVLRLSAGVRVSPSKELPRLAWGTVQDLKVSGSQGKYDLSILFTPFHPGTQTFPAFKLGDASVEGLKVHVRSLVDEGFRESIPPQGQLLLPSTKLFSASSSAASSLCL